MKQVRRCVKRRAILTASMGAGFAFQPCVAAIPGKSEFDVLDTIATKVRRPASVFLVAIARAGRRLVAVGEHGVIIYSDDGGSTWTQATVPVDVTLTCVAFITPLLGWVAGNLGVILRTSDGGENWRLQLDGRQANQLTLVAAQTAAAQKSTVPGAEFALRRANVFVQQGAAIPFLTILVFSPSKAIVFGANRMTMLTSDGGNTWQDWSLHIYERYSRDVYDAIEVDAALYLAGESGAVFRSQDGGDTFLPVAATSDATLFGILATKNGSIVVFGVAGTCFRSTDNCQVWSPIALPTQNDTSAGLVLKSGSILIADEAGNFFVSMDDGASFAPVPGIATASAFDLLEEDDGSLVVTGAAGVTKISAADLKI